MKTTVKEFNLIVDEVFGKDTSSSSNGNSLISNGISPQVKKFVNHRGISKIDTSATRAYYNTMKKKVVSDRS